MAEIVIDASDLRREGAEKVKNLGKFLKERLDADLKVETDTITLRENIPPKAYLRILIRKFLHRSKLKEKYRLISGGGNTMIVKRRKPRGE